MVLMALTYNILGVWVGLVSARAGRVTHLRVLVRTVGRYVRTRWIWKRGDRRRWPETRDRARVPQRDVTQFKNYLTSLM
jgi:hypothetical protein